MSALPHSERHRFNAAAGWLELGDMVEALSELRKIPPPYKSHPSVLDLHWQILARRKDWIAATEVAQHLVESAPDNQTGWIHRSYALHELRRTQEARDLLLPGIDKFPEVVLIPYNLACYACQMKDMEQAKSWLKRAVDIQDRETVRRMAEEDPDLAPLRKFVRTL